MNQAARAHAKHQARGKRGPNCFAQETLGGGGRVRLSPFAAEATSRPAAGRPSGPFAGALLQQRSRPAAARDLGALPQRSPLGCKAGGHLPRPPTGAHTKRGWLPSPECRTWRNFQAGAAAAGRWTGAWRGQSSTAGAKLPLPTARLARRRPGHQEAHVPRGHSEASLGAASLRDGPGNPVSGAEKQLCYWKLNS